MLDLFIVGDFFDAAECASILDELQRSSGDPATVYGTSDAAAINPGVRRAARLTPSPDTRDLIVRRLEDRRESVERHFGVVLAACEEPQFLRYREGDFFVAHQDGNTPLLRHTSQARSISVVIFLSVSSDDPSPETYGGGALVFYGAFPDLSARLPLTPEPGTLVAFRAETTHEVTPVTHGERYTIASWYLQ